MNKLKTFSRLVLGLVFTFSGFVKAVDPVGSQIKFDDYFNAMGLPQLLPFALVLAFILSSLEFLVGIALLLNMKTRLAAFGALAFMVVFTPLTLWIALANPVSDCGCFGDAIVLTNWETFWKNIILLVLAIFLIIKSKEGEPYFTNIISYSSLTAGLVFIIFFQFYNLNNLPVIDFRPYSVGTYLPNKMIVPLNAPKDSVTTYLYYEKDGVTKEFTMDNYPWEDTTWVWKDTKTVVVQKGYVPPIHDLDIYSFTFKNVGMDTSVNALGQLLADTSYSLLLIVNNLRTAPLRKVQSLTNIVNYCKVHNYKSYFITSSLPRDILKMNAHLPFAIKFYLADATTLKTIIRSNPGLVLLKDATVIAKWHYNNFPSLKEFEEVTK